MKKLIILLLMVLLTLGVSAGDKVKFIASGVTCSMCSNAIHKSLSLDKKILKIKPNLETQEWVLEYSDGGFIIEDLKKIVEGAGFGIFKLWVNDKLVLDKSKKKK